MAGTLPLSQMDLSVFIRVICGRLPLSACFFTTAGSYFELYFVFLMSSSRLVGLFSESPKGSQGNKHTWLPKARNMIKYFDLIFLFPPVSYVIPLWFLCKSHFPPILRNGPETDLKRTYNGPTTDLQRRHIFNVISMKKGKRIYEINAETQRRGDYFLLNTEDTEWTKGFFIR